MKGPQPGLKPAAFPPNLYRELDMRRQEEIRKGRDVITLAVGDPDLPTPAPVADFAAAAVKKTANHRYPFCRGSAALRAEIAAWHKKRHGIKLDPDSEVLALIGSKEGLAHLPLALTDRGDSVLVPDPSYPVYKTGVLLSEGRVELLPLEEKNGFLPDFGKIPEKALSRAKLLFLNYPNNPTGAVAGFDFYKEAVRFCRKNDLWLAQDAAYSEIFFGKPGHSVLEVQGARDIAVEFYSFSKTYCMTGWRMGWLAGSARAVRALTRIKENMDAGQFNAVQETAAFCLRHHKLLSEPVRKTFKNRSALFVRGLRAAGWKVFSPEASFFVWARPPGGGGALKAVLRMLDEVAVLAMPGSFFGSGGEGYVRFSLCAPEARLKDAVRRLAGLKW